MVKAPRGQVQPPASASYTANTRAGTRSATSTVSPGAAAAEPNAPSTRTGRPGPCRGPATQTWTPSRPRRGPATEPWPPPPPGRRPGVAAADPQAKTLARRQVSQVRGEGLVGPAGVAKTMTEGELGGGSRRVIAPVTDEQSLVVAELPVTRDGVQNRAVSLVRRNRDGQPAARLGLAEQDVGQCLTHGLAGQPGIDHRGGPVRPRHEHRHAGVH